MADKYMHQIPQSMLPFLRPLGLPYALIMQQRRQLYASGRLAAYAPGLPTLSVGNIAMGGTGKTPLVSHLLDLASASGRKAVVLTRGYKGKPGDAPLVVSAETPVAASGDEALMLARMHPKAQVIAFAQRAVSARFAEKTLAPDLFILDDGMQHLAVKRDLDIVLLRPEDLTSAWDRVLPAGPWREGKVALRSADAFAIKATPERAHALEKPVMERLGKLGRPVFFFSVRPLGLSALFPANGEHGTPRARPGRAPLLDPATYRDGAYILVSGVGNPTAVAETAARTIGRRPVQHFDFADHHAYTAGDMQAVLKLAAAPLPVVCTAKDAVKLATFADIFDTRPVRVLETSLEFGPKLMADLPFDQWWEKALGEAFTRRQNAGRKS